MTSSNLEILELATGLVEDTIFTPHNIQCLQIFYIDLNIFMQSLAHLAQILTIKGFIWIRQNSDVCHCYYFRAKACEYFRSRFKTLNSSAGEYLDCILGEWWLALEAVNLAVSTCQMSLTWAIFMPRRHNPSRTLKDCLPRWAPPSHQDMDKQWDYISPSSGEEMSALPSFIRGFSPRKDRYKI